MEHAHARESASRSRFGQPWRPGGRLKRAFTPSCIPPLVGIVDFRCATAIFYGRNYMKYGVLPRDADWFPESIDGLMTSEEAARWLGIGRSTLYELLAAGEIPSVQLGRCRRIPTWVLRQVIEEKINR
jgi:excisionase family DNA binding protein